jgi:integrase
MTTRTPKTDAAYRNRAGQIERAAAGAANRELSRVEVAEWLLGRHDLSANSFRQMRRSLSATWAEDKAKCPERGSEYDAAIALLHERKCPRPAARTNKLRTSQLKQKGLSVEDFERICHAVRAGRSPNAIALTAYLHSAMLAGVRFVEWPTAKFGPSQTRGFRYELILENGKQGNERAHGPIRTLRWHDLPEDLVSELTTWIKIAAEADRIGNYQRLYRTLGGLMHDVSAKLFPRRKLLPALSSARHAATARWKQLYLAEAKSAEERDLGRAIIAALMGHASDESATRHYARARSGGGQFPSPHAEPAEVARVRRRYAAPSFKCNPNPSGP